MQAVQNIAVINNRPSIWGDAALALVRASGLLEEFEEWKEGTEYTDGWTAYCKVKRHGDTKATIESFSWADAKRAKLTPADSSSPWTKYPKRMLQMRARSWPLRDKFTDVLKGLQIREEAPDIVPMRQTAKGSYAPEAVELPAGTVLEASKDGDSKAYWQLHATLDERDQAAFVTFTQETAAAQDIDIEDVECAVTDELKDAFLGQFRAWQKSPQQKQAPDEHSIIGQFRDKKNTGFAEWLHANKDRIPIMPDAVQVALEEKCQRMFLKRSLADTLSTMAGNETEKVDVDPATGAVNGSGEMIDCPNDLGSQIYASECVHCRDREGCPAHD